MFRLKRWNKFLVVGLGVALLGAIVFAAYFWLMPRPAFSREQTIAYAKQQAPQSRPEVGMMEARIDEITAELMSLREAYKRMNVGSSATSDAKVWLVVVKGKFVYEGMAPPGTRQFFESASQFFILDAATGNSDVSGFSRARLVGVTPLPPELTPTP